MSGRLRALAVLVAVLIIGCLLGIAGFHLFVKQPREDRAFSSLSRDTIRPKRLAEKLDLTSEQQAQLKRILEDSRRQINASRAEMEQELGTIRSQTNDKIAAILTEAQKKEFQQIVKEAESHGPGGHRREGGDHPRER